MKNHKKLKITGIVLGSILVFLLTINLIPPKKVIDNNPFITDGLPMIAAHRGGAINNPENTLKAYKEAVYTYQVDILESDLHLTKDGYLVYNHDETINDTCDVIDIEKAKLGPSITEEQIKQIEEKDYKVSDFTLEELRNFNFGYNFPEDSEEKLYRNIEGLDGPNRKQILKDNGLQIVEASELFKEFYTSHPDLKFIVELKNSGKEGNIAADTLNDILNQFPEYRHQIVIGTFNDETAKYLKETYPDLMRGAPMGEAAVFIVTEILKLNIFDPGDFACLQIPKDFDIGFTLKLDNEMYIKRAHRRNIAVQYWTIDDEETMRRLIDIKCDAIMTDDPKLLREVLSSYN